MKYCVRYLFPDCSPFPFLRVFLHGISISCLGCPKKAPKTLLAFEGSSGRPLFLPKKDGTWKGSLGNQQNVSKCFRIRAATCTRNRVKFMIVSAGIIVWGLGHIPLISGVSILVQIDMYVDRIELICHEFFGYSLVHWLRVFALFFFRSTVSNSVRAEMLQNSCSAKRTLLARQYSHPSCVQI